MGVALHEIVSRYLNNNIDLAATGLGIFDGFKIEEIVLWCIALAWLFLLSAMLILLSYKLNQMSAMLVLVCYHMDIPQGLEAKAVLSSSLETTEEALRVDDGETRLHDLILALYENHANHMYQFLQFTALVGVALLLAQLLQLLRAAYRTILTYPCNCKTTLYAQLMNNDAIVALPVKTFSLPMHRCNVIQKPTISMVDSYTCKIWSPYIEIIWSSSLHLSYLGQIFEYDLPTKVYCPWVSRSAVNNIIKQRQIMPVLAFMSMSAECVCSSGLIKKAKRSMVQSRKCCMRVLVQRTTCCPQ